MDLIIENKLSEHQTHLIDYATLKSILTSLNYENINAKIANLKKKNILKSIKKGFYIHNSSITKNIISKELLSNNLLDNPSYISLDYALYFYGLIPEVVHEITAITTKRSKVFETNIGIFSYTQTKTALFKIGLRIESFTMGNFLIASKEKALCDKVYFTRNIELTAKTKMIEFLKDDLRIDLEDLEGLDTHIFREYYDTSKSKKIYILLNLIKDL